MPAHSKSSSAPLGLALGAGCVLAAPLFVAPGGRGAAPQVRGQPVHGEQAVEAPVEATSLPSSTAVGVAMMGAAAVAAHRGRTECQRVQGTKVACKAFENELGVQAPVGFWDPVGFTKDGDVEEFTRRRGVEVKHGRIAMLATMGYITPELTGKFPGYLSPSLELKYEDIPNGLAAISKVPQAGWAQILAYCFFAEATSDFGKSPDCGWKPPLLATDDATLKTKRLNAEIANGRLAMMAIIGMFFQDGLTGSAWGDWALYTDSPLRAFENELGVQAPVGFWDPLGLSADGDEAVFKRRRETEIKHGRVSMLATMGYITPELTGKFPGYLSPSLGLKYEDIPNGLAALSKVPLAGWFQIVLYCLYCEASGLGFGYFDAAAAEPGDKGWRPPLLATDDPELKKKRLNAEIANGRLAMMAIIGMFFQDGLTGSAWGDWSLYTDSPLRAFENELGVQAPVGFWDPLRLAADGDVNAFRRRRETEIKHGRISMLATMGYITPELTGKLPGELSPSLGIKYADIPNGLGAISKVPAAGWLQILLYCGFCEFSSVNAYIGKGYFDASIAEPGDKGWRPPLLATDDAERKKKRLNSELANGRLAMMAIIGMFYQDGLTGSAWGDWALFTESNLRAFENELGVQAPVGFWDPLGLSADGDEAVFKRRRETEIKHGRVSMLATMGYITPELTGKFPGYLSPSLGLKYEDIPNGLAALSKVPLAGWFQIVLYCLYCEASGLGFGYFDAAAAEPGDKGWRPPLLATDDPELKKKRLNAEIANGRLAMMAIIGMFFQDGLTGSAWGDWALYTDSPLRAFENELGVQAPVGFWDPLRLAADGDVNAFRRRRETEIKHGRISMLATMGYITPELTGKLPGYLSPSLDIKYADIPNGLGAISKVPAAGWLQILLYCGFCEFSSVNAYIGKGYFDASIAEPGDKGWRPPLLATDDAERKKKRLNSEIANGRLAMMAIIGMFYQDGLTGSAWGDWALFTESNLRAFENELGVQAPVGFWDPLGLSADGDEAVFKRRRETEIKHGRVSMLATMGYITPELTGKFPGYLSPSLGLKYEDIPNGLAALSKVPLAGWFQIVLYCLYCEASGLGFGYFDAAAAEPGDKGWRPPLLATDDPELKKKRLNAEIANGRLAMMAIIGMFFQDGLTGSAWGDWALYTDSPLRAFENELGVQAPVGFWDPLRLAADGDVNAFRRRRETEIKHGRISMLATMGYITPELTGKLPGYLSPSLDIKYADIPNGLGAISKVPAAGWLQILLYCGFCEFSSVNAYIGKGYFDASIAEPGDKGWRPPLLATDDAERKTKRLNSELANGRLAMMAIIGMFYQDGLTGSAWGDWALFTESNLRAFENELGVQAPVGFWDPLGLSADGDEAVFKRRRETEIKHGRVSMLATMGYITPELTGKFPGYLSPSLGLKYEDIPNGLAALSKVPLAGWFQIVLYCLYCEASGLGFGYFDAAAAEPGDKGWRPPLLATDDAELKKKRLNAEIANGRLAMMAIIGMFFQDGLTGSAWGDWANYTDSPLR